MAGASRFEALPWFVGSGDRIIHFFSNAPHALLINRQQHLFLGLKVVVDRAGEHPDFFRNVAHGSGVETTFIEEARGGVQKLDTPVILARSA